MSEGEPTSFDRIVATGERAKAVWELGSFLITAGTAILAFVASVGGPVQFLIEVSVIGFAAYVALFVVVVPALLLLSSVEALTRWTSTDTTYVVIGALAAVLGAAVIRFGIFQSGRRTGPRWHWHGVLRGRGGNSVADARNHPLVQARQPPRKNQLARR